jgi:hypothetical protein
MAQLFLQITVSLDGYIEGSHAIRPDDIVRLKAEAARCCSAAARRSFRRTELGANFSRSIR